MAAAAEPTPPAAAAEPNHGLRIALIWLVLALAADLLIWFVWGPHMPPGTWRRPRPTQQFDIKVLAVMAAPVMVLVLVYFSYALIVWRHRDGDDTDGPPIHGNTRVQATWITVTSVIVLAVFVFGTVELATCQRRGRGPGPEPDLEARRHAAAGPGDRAAVAVHLPVPAVRRVRDHGPGAAGQPVGRSST